MSTFRPPGQTTPFWTSLVRYYRSCLSREQELALQVPADPNARVLLRSPDEHLISRKATTTIVADPAHTKPILAYLNRRGRGITGTFIYGYPLAREGEQLYPVCYTEVSLEPGTAPQTVVLTRGARELLFNRRFLRFHAGLTDAEISELTRSWLSSRGPEPAQLLDQYLAGVDLQYDAVLFGAEGLGQVRGPARELQLMEQLRKDRLPDTIRIFSGEQGLPSARETDDYLAVLPADADQVRVLKRWQVPFMAVTGPAGSGRGRTAANLVATAAAAGRLVLYVTPGGRLPDEFTAAFPGVLHIGSREAWLSSLQYALRVLQELKEQDAAPPDASALTAQSRELGRELDRLQAEQRHLASLATLGVAVEPVAARVEAEVTRHPRRAWIEALAGQVTAANAAQFSPEQLTALRELHLRALAWLDDSGSLGLLGQRRRTGQIKTALRQAGVPDFCHPEGDLREQVAGLSLLIQAYPLLLVRARRLLAGAVAGNSPAQAAANAAAAAERKAAVDRQLLRAAWLRRAAGLRPHLDQIIAAVTGEIEALEKGGPQRSVLSRQRFTDLLRAFPVVVSPHLAVAGVVPNEPELFDLLVLDDASQVSIPAFLPVLYRARRAVLLGDESGAAPISCLGPEEDSRLLGQVEGHNLAAFAYTEVTPLHRALAVTGPQTLRLGGRYHPRERAQFVNVDDGQTLFPAPAAVSQAQNPLEARAVLLQATRLIDAGVSDIALCSPFSGQVHLLRQLLARLAEAERDPGRAAALRAIRVYAADEIASRHRAVLISLVLAGGATPESLNWLNERSRHLARALDCATERAVLVGRRETLAGIPAVAGLLDGEAGRAEADAPGLRPEALGFLPAERAQHEACLAAENAVTEGLTGPARELYNRLAALLRQRNVLLAPRLPLAWTLGPALANLPGPLRDAVPAVHPLVTVLDRDSLLPLAVVELEAGEPGPAAGICSQAGIRYLAVAPGDWDRLREIKDG
ncbi:hypothetical protein J2Z79_002749 [Symbiobacterium terraclitae]|uniref:DNA2/NAM7 helicase-like C-terminal domain-containing protein n=1 Tax=Symbiobacterium terraclitae TaxID=557451 RepID=A0ABS4JUV6_9FIRM|nr:hypothetical protein [Symbiobacterium terraclitae]MBP2019322.1 hypothetical protein [Symbiobacterium terraclitae]